MLSNVQDDSVATKIAVNLLINFWKPEPCNHQFPSVADLAKGLQHLRKKYNGETGPIPASYVVKAELFFSELLSTNKKRLLLHGDFHHYNIIQIGDHEWKMIDPKGVIGEPEYKVVTYLKNELLNKSDPLRLLNLRIKQFVAELQLDEERVLKWGYCQSILSAWWCVEDRVGIGMSLLRLLVFMSNF